MLLVLLTLLGADLETPCGPAALEALLRALGRPCSPQQITTVCREVTGRSDLRHMSVAELMAAAQSLGVSLTAVEVDPPNHEILPAPAILYLEPPASIGNRPILGHFVVLLGKGPDTVTVLDPALGTRPHQVSISSLYGHWSGIAVIPTVRGSRRGVLQPFAIGVAAGLALYWVVAVALRRRLGASAFSVAAFVAAVAFGCGPSERPLTIEPRRVDLGTVRSERATVRVTLKAWRRGPVTISDVSADCAGLRYRPELKGEVLQPGEQRAVELIVSGDGTGRDQVFLWQVLTTPPGSGAAATLVTGRFYPVPVVHPNPIHLRVPFGRSHDATVTVVAIRPAGEPPLAVRPVPKGHSPIRLTAGARISQSHYRGRNGRAVSVRDLQELRLHVPGTLPLGRHRAEYRLDLGSRWRPITLVLTADVMHPVVFEQTSLFAGVMATGARWEYELPYEELVAGVAEQMRIAPTAPWIGAELDSSRRVLKLWLTVPRRGRFAGRVRIEFGARTPPAWIRVSGVGVDQRSDRAEPRDAAAASVGPSTR